MKKLISLAALVLLASTIVSQAFEKEKFISHFRKEFSLDSRLPITVGDPKPSQFAGLKVFPVNVGGQTQQVYLSKDERYYFWGVAMDMTQDPDKTRAAKLNLTNVHMKGSSTATVTIVEFSDIQCPNCQQAHKAVD